MVCLKIHFHVHVHVHVHLLYINKNFVLSNMLALFKYVYNESYMYMYNAKNR